MLAIFLRLKNLDLLCHKNSYSYDSVCFILQINEYAFLSCHYILTTFEICILFACHSWWEQQWYIDLFSLYRFISQFTCTCYTIHVFLFYLYLYKKYYINKLCIVCYWCVESRSLSLIMLSLIKLSINMIQFLFFNSLILHSFGYPFIQMLGCLEIVRSFNVTFE